jgi:hypothetical protein
MQPQSEASKTKYQGGINERHIQVAHESTSEGPKSAIALRLTAGGVFFWEGILKFV